MHLSIFVFHEFIGVTKLKKIIRLTDEEIQRCEDFAKKSAGTQHAIEFGQWDTVPRNIKEIYHDTVTGKMGEVASSNMLKTDYGIDCPVNFEIYDIYTGDDCDIRINSWNIDVKATIRGQWLLIEKDRIRMRQRQVGNNLPAAILMCKVWWNKETDKPTGVVELVGIVSLSRLLSGWPAVIRLKKGECIPNTQARLQADNYAVHFSNLCSDWDTAIGYMIHNEPPCKSAYVIP